MIPAIDRLRSLRAGQLPLTDSDRLEPDVCPEKLPEEWREMYEERAAIREYDGGQAREHAEAEALCETLAAMRRTEKAE